jgi:hypothetical protein
MSIKLCLQELQARPSAARTLALLNSLADEYLTAGQLLAFHEQLLFFKAYPPSRSIRKLCDRELGLFHERVAALDEYARAQLDLSGIVSTKMTYAYEFPLARWLIGLAGNKIDIDWEIFEEHGNEKLEDLLSILMEASEGDAIDAPDVTVREYFDAARGNHSSLQWLLTRMEKVYSPKSLWPTYDALLLDLSFDLHSPAPSRTLVEDNFTHDLHVWNPQQPKQKINFMREITRPLKIGPPVSKKRGRELHDLVHGSLLVRLREFYTATRANPEEFYDIYVGRGMRLILWFSTPEYRLPLESGQGFLLVKNGVPIGYGGGGMHAHRMEIAINIFDTYRGGDAGWIYAQTARVCYSVCGSPWIVARKYQFGGEKNMEGLTSGAFWFYYKMGFRSVDPEVRELAEAERRLILKKRGYRTPIKTLRKFAVADAVLSLTGEDAAAYVEPPLGEIGMLVPKVIAERYGGNRTNLTAKILKDLRKLFGATTQSCTKSERERLAQLGLFMLAIPGIETWSRRDLDKMIRLGKLKGSQREGDYIKAMRKNLRFYDALQKLVSP